MIESNPTAELLEGAMSPFASFREIDSTLLFQDRHEAGEKLAQAVLDELLTESGAGQGEGIPTKLPPFVIYALPKGGLPIAAPMAAVLRAPLDVVVAKKITRPDNPELAIGAVTADGQVVWSPQRRLPQPPSAFHTRALELAQRHAEAQWQQLSPGGRRTQPQGAIALVVDDGIATGMTMAAAVKSLRAQQAAQVWVCAPVAPPELLPFLTELSDRVIVLATPTPFHSVSRFYKAFAQVTLEEACAYLQ